MSDGRAEPAALPRFPYAIIGLGLLGGSLARAVRVRFGSAAGLIIGVDPDANTRAAALADGVVDEAYAEVGAALTRAGLVVIATPLAALADLLPRLAAVLASGTLVCDVIGVKGPVMPAIAAALPNARHVSAHPMAGGEHGGFAHSRSDLFVARTVVVCPHPDDAAATAAVSALWQRLGARTVECSPREHDRIIAATSHLPYLAALALVRVALREEGGAHIAGRGFADATRRADFDPTVMAAVVSQNSFAPRAVRALADELRRLADLIERAPQALEGEARAIREEHRALVGRSEG